MFLGVHITLQGGIMVEETKEKGSPRVGEYSWCVRHQRGVKGSPGELCPECLRDKDGDNNSIETVLMTGAEAEARTHKIAEAIKLARSSKEHKAPKTPQDYVRESEEKTSKKINELDSKIDRILSAIEKPKPVETVLEQKVETVIEKPQTPKSNKLESVPERPKALKKEAK